MGPAPWRASPPPDGSVFVHLFEWRWTDIARECETYLGPRGFEAVQISPPMEHLVLRPAGFPWWQRYQPVSYSLAQSRSGTVAEFEDMVTRCARMGVGIYVDAVINHMSARESGLGSAGTRFTKYAYPNLYGPEDFHSPPCAIEGADYVNDRARVQTCELLALSDLATGSERVQESIADYLAGLVEKGVRGFRIDAAKHMAAADLNRIAAMVRARVGEERSPYYYHEVFTYGGEAVTGEEYLAVADAVGDQRADVIEFRYARLGDYVRNAGELKLKDLKELFDAARDFVPSDRAVVFVDNHDTQRNGGMSYHDGKIYDLAVIALLAAPYGYPGLMSSYAFDRTAGRDRGPPSDANGRTDDLYGEGEQPRCASERVPEPGNWVCEHRRSYVPAMLAFRRAAGTAALSNFWDNGDNQVAFARDRRAFVVLNAESSELRREFATGLPEGRYCDVVPGLPGDDCVGASFEVDGSGRAQISVPALGAVALFVGASR